jgi:AraC-like DNA-binding protein
MSRSAFAREFKEHVGLPPLDYLIRWHMHLARQARHRGDAPVSTIAASLGYSSESAFGNVFESSPKRYWIANPSIGTPFD